MSSLLARGCFLYAPGGGHYSHARHRCLQHHKLFSDSTNCACRRSVLHCTFCVQSVEILKAFFSSKSRRPFFCGYNFQRFHEAMCRLFARRRKLPGQPPENGEIENRFVKKKRFLFLHLTDWLWLEKINTELRSENFREDSSLSEKQEDVLWCAAKVEEQHNEASVLIPTSPISYCHLSNSIFLSLRSVQCWITWLHTVAYVPHCYSNKLLSLGMWMSTLCRRKTKTVTGLFLTNMFQDWAEMWGCEAMLSDVWGADSQDGHGDDGGEGGETPRLRKSVFDVAHRTMDGMDGMVTWTTAPERNSNHQCHKYNPVILSSVGTAGR